jgi:hypothetical protein
LFDNREDTVMRLSFLSVVAMAGCVVGCNKSPEGGTNPNSPNPQAGFKISSPVSALTSDIKQGDSSTYNESLDRDSDFKRDVHLSAAATDKGLSVKLNKDTIKASDDTKFTVQVTAAKDAALGEHVIKVTGTPDGGGNPTTGEFKVKVIENK